MDEEDMQIPMAAENEATYTSTTTETSRDI